MKHGRMQTVTSRGMSVRLRRLSVLLWMCVPVRVVVSQGLVPSSRTGGGRSSRPKPTSRPSVIWKTFLQRSGTSATRLGTFSRGWRTGSGFEVLARSAGEAGSTRTV